MLRPEPISVSDLNSYIKDKIGNDEFLNNVYIKGEISNFKHHYYNVLHIQFCSHKLILLVDSVYS